MNFILFDSINDWQNLLPITFTRPISEIRCGILTIRQKWEKYLNSEIYYLTKSYLQKKFKLSVDADNILINAKVLPNKDFVNAVLSLEKDTVLMQNNEPLALRIDRNAIAEFNSLDFSKFKNIEYQKDITKIDNLWDIFVHNEKEIEKDFKLLTEGRESQEISKTNLIFKPERIFVEQGAEIEGAVLNPLEGYIYIGKDVLIMEGSVVRGSFAMCEHSQMKIGAKIYGATTLGPYVKVGGEVSNSVLIGYSNKAHDGFLGNAVIGEWCNLGAGTNNSNLKNNYAEVKIWNYKKKGFVKTGLQFCGLFMGDHSKSGINTMFNTGTVVGVSANIYGAGFPRNFIPSFSWGGASGFQEYKLNKALETAELVMARRHKKLNEIEKDILSTVFDMTKEFRH